MDGKPASRISAFLVDGSSAAAWRRAEPTVHLAASGGAGGADGGGPGEAVVPASDYRALQGQLREIQRLGGQKTMEAEILNETLEVAAQKSLRCARSRQARAMADEDGL